MLANGIEGISKRPITARRVRTWIAKHRSEAKYYSPLKPVAGRADTWLATIHSARLLTDLFAELSEKRVTYDKTEHGTALTKWLVTNAAEELREVSELLKSFLSGTEIL